MRTSTQAIAIAVVAALLSSGCWPVPPPDDAGSTSFYDQFLPLVLGRRLRNAQERQYLLDLEALYGRQVVMDLLMGEPEFLEHWRDNLLRGMELQRGGMRGQSEQCFGAPMRLSGGGDSGELASFIRDNPVTANFPGTSVFADPGAEAVPDDPINMSDVVLSALELDDLSVIYKAYAVPLVVEDGMLGAEEIGRAFNRAFLNRNLDCTECHSVAEQLLIKPIQIDLEPQVFGCAECAGAGAEIDPSEIWSIFRQDITGDDAPAGQSTIRPWGLHPSCGTLATEFTGGSQPTVFAGLSGGYTGLPHLIDQFSAGVESIRSNGLSFSAGTYLDHQELPPDQSLVYMVSAKIVENVWEDLLGYPLTEAHYYARNDDQRDMHRYLTESFIGSGWSLRELISLVMVTGYANRRAPAQSVQASPNVLAPIFDAFAGTTNGQGELVFRYPPHALFSQARHSLGWPRWDPFPGSGYPSLDLNRDLEQYLSDSSSGARDWSFQSLLAWESTVASCENPDGGADWIDRLMTAAEEFDTAHPEDPLTVRDVVRTVKDRLVGDPRISNGPEGVIDDFENDGGQGICCAPEPPDDWASPGDGDDDAGDFVPLPPPEADTELEALEAMFGTGLHNPSSSVPELELKVRRLCGTLLKSPQRVLAGIVDREASGSSIVPRLVVGNPGEPATYGQICQSYRPGLARLGRDVTCGPGGVFETPGITIQPNPYDAARRESETERIRNFLASLDDATGLESRRSLLIDPRTGAPIPDEDLETILAWARASEPEELVGKIPPALLHGAAPDAGSYDLLLQEARRAVQGCESDRDGDGLCDEVDPCLYYPNRLPLLDANGDGLPEECQCGDADGSGRLDTGDVTIVSECATSDPGARREKSCVLGIAQGETNGSGRFEREDALLLQDAILGKIPAYSLRCSVRAEGTAPPRSAGR